MKDGDNEQSVRTPFYFGALGKLDWFSISLGSSLGDAAVRELERTRLAHKLPYTNKVRLLLLLFPRSAMRSVDVRARGRGDALDGWRGRPLLGLGSEDKEDKAVGSTRQFDAGITCLQVRLFLFMSSFLLRD